MNSYEYIQELKRIKGFKTDYEAAKRLGWKPNKIYQYRDGQTMDNEAAREIAEVLEVPVLKIIADMEAERQKDPAKKNAWRMLSKMQKEAGRATAKFLISLPFFAFMGQILYIMLNSGKNRLALGECEYSL